MFIYIVTPNVQGTGQISKIQYFMSYDSKQKFMRKNYLCTPTFFVKTV